MLVLSRKQNQTIVIDNQIEIEVLKIKGNTVRLGIKAPSHIKVLRGELSPFEIEVNLSDLGDSRISANSANSANGSHTSRNKQADDNDALPSRKRSENAPVAKSNSLANPFAVIAAASS